MVASWFRRGALAACAAAALVAAPALAQSALQDGQSTFVSSDKSLMFGFTIPTDATDDVVVTLRAPIDLEWAAVGLGSDGMDKSLILMMYKNAAGNNVTFSPRVAYGRYEPVPYTDLSYQVLNGTGLYNGHMVFSMRCSRGCRNWPNGYVDTSSPDQKAIYAVGPEGGFQSDDPAASVRFHRQIGAFHIDMGRTRGADDAPYLDDNSVSEGTTLGWDNDSKWDYKSSFHATFMIFCFVVLMPVGILLLRVGQYVRWHAVNQGIALLGVLLGAMLGILTSFMYQRSRGFKSPHQIIGLVATGLLIAQFAIGFLHHQRYKRTQRPTKLSVPHIWLGRVVVLLGVVNAFIGFPFALNPRNDFALGGLIVIVIPICFALVYYRARRRRTMAVPPGAPPPYSTEPWRRVEPQSPSYGGFAPSPAYAASPAYRDGAAYDAPPQQVGLADLDHEGRKETGAPRGTTGGGSQNRDLGAEVQPRELV